MPNIEVRFNIMPTHKHTSYMKSRALIFCYQNVYALAFSPIGANNHAYFIHTKMIILIILEEKYKCGNFCYVTFL